MKNDEILKFKRLFESERKKIVLTNELINESYHLPSDGPQDSGDLNSSELEASIRLHLRNREMLYLRKVEEALRKISDGTFGTCETCEQEIGKKRLEVRPTATLCIDCKEEQEHTQSRHVIEIHSRRDAAIC